MLLTEQQLRRLEELKDCLRRLETWNGATPSRISREGEAFALVFGDYEIALRRAVLAGLENHHLVKVRLDTLRALGAREALAQFRTKNLRLGLNRGVLPALTGWEQQIVDTIERCIDEGLRWEAIRVRLIQGGLIPDMSSQSFHKLVDRVGVQRFFLSEGGGQETVVGVNSLRDRMALKRSRA